MCSFSDFMHDRTTMQQWDQANKDAQEAKENSERAYVRNNTFNELMKEAKEHKEA